MCPGSRALGERGGYLRHAARQEADDHHRPAGAPAGVSGERNTDGLYSPLKRSADSCTENSRIFIESVLFLNIRTRYIHSEVTEYSLGCCGTTAHVKMLYKSFQPDLWHLTRLKLHIS